MMGSSKHGNEPSSSTKGWEILCEFISFLKSLIHKLLGPCPSALLSRHQMEVKGLIHSPVPLTPRTHWIVAG